MPDLESEPLRRIYEDLAREKQLIACDLHDGPIQLVIGSMMQLESIDLDEQRFTSADRQKIEQATKLLSQAIQELRNLIGDLNAGSIEPGFLKAELLYLIEQFHNQGPTQVHFSCQAELDRLDPLLAGSLFHIVQEALNNVRVHARATQVWILISRKEQRIGLEILDDGTGISEDRLDAGPESIRHFGLRGMRNRARIFAGEFKLESSAIDPAAFQQSVESMAARWNGSGEAESALSPAAATGTLVAVEFPDDSSPEEDV